MFRSILLIITIFIVMITSCSSNSETDSKKNTPPTEKKTPAPQQAEYEIIKPKMLFDFLEPFQSVLGKIVFIKKDIYGGDLEYNCILRGRVRNVTNEPIKNIYIIWYFWDEYDHPIEISPTSYYNPPPLFWSDKIDYLDSKAEVDFEITLHLRKMAPRDGKAIRQAVLNTRNEACVFVRSN